MQQPSHCRDWPSRLQARQTVPNAITDPLPRREEGAARSVVGPPPGKFERPQTAGRSMVYCHGAAALAVDRQDCRRLYRGRFEMSALKRLFQLDFTPVGGQRKMPTAYKTAPSPRADTRAAHKKSRLTWRQTAGPFGRGASPLNPPRLTGEMVAGIGRWPQHRSIPGKNMTAPRSRTTAGRSVVDTVPGTDGQPPVPGRVNGRNCRRAAADRNPSCQNAASASRSEAWISKSESR